MGRDEDHTYTVYYCFKELSKSQQMGFFFENLLNWRVLLFPSKEKLLSKIYTILELQLVVVDKVNHQREIQTGEEITDQK